MASIRGFPAGGGFDLDVQAGEVVRLVGPNGCGKTSLLRALAGLPAPLRPAGMEAHRSAMVFQSARDGLIGLTVAGEYRMRDLPGRGGDQDSATLSQGEARRLGIDLAFSSGAPLVLLDEPAQGLDGAAVEDLCDRLGSGPTVILADHDDRLADVCDRTVAMGRPLPGLHRDLPKPTGGVVLEAGGGTIRRGARTIPCPPWQGHPGLHVVRGPNGCGKSSWLLALAGLIPGLDVRIDAHAVRPGRDVRLLLPGIHDHAHEATVDEAVPAGLEALVPTPLRTRHPLSLSGGEARRVALAKVLAQPARVYLLDEPEAHLDTAARRALWDLLARRIQEGACILAASQDPQVQAAAHSVIDWGSP